MPSTESSYYRLRRLHPLWLAPCLLLCLNLVGCGDTGLTMTPVSGKVTFDGQPPPNSGSVTFVSVNKRDELPQRDGAGFFDPDGRFTATSYKTGDGLLPGTYRVEIECYKHEPDYSNPDPFGEATAVSPEYKPMELVVEKGQPVTNLIVDVPLRKEAQ